MIAKPDYIAPAQLAIDCEVEQLRCNTYFLAF